MSKILVAVRLEPEVVDLLKDLAKKEGKTQTEIVTLALGMFHSALLYSDKFKESKAIQESNKKTKGKWIIC